jgi:hypothetical protein
MSGGDLNMCEDCGNMSESEGDQMSEIERDRREREREREREIARAIDNYIVDCDCADCLLALDNMSEGEQAASEGEIESERIEIDRFTCSLCRFEVNSGESGDYSLLIAANGDPYHDHCLMRAIITCEHCGWQLSPYDYIQAREGGDPYCRDCASEHYRYCQHCGRYEDRETSGEIVAMGIEICEDCLSGGELIACEDCGELAGSSGRPQYEDRESGDPLCYTCYNKREREREREQARARIASKIESGELKKIELPSLITEACEGEIVALLKGDIRRRFIEVQASDRAIDYALQSIDFLALISGRELVNKGGKLAKRLKNNMRREHGIKLDPSLISEIGNIAHNYSLAGGDHIIELTSDLENTAGSFGDSGSCFQSGGAYHNHLRAMEYSGDFLALRVYSGEGDRRARAWIYIGDHLPILFNSYGERLNKLADLYAAASEREIGKWQWIDLDSRLYINNGEGILIGGEGDREDYYIDCDPDDCNDYYEGEHCEDCGGAIADHELCEHEGDHYCEDCFHRLFSMCDNCEDYYTSDQMSDRPIHKIAASGRVIDRHYCEDCASEIADDCELCGKQWIEDCLQWIEGDSDRQLCDNCAIESGEDCELCGELYIASEGGKIGGDLACSQCLRERQAAAIAAILSEGGDYRYYCDPCRSIALQRRAMGDQAWASEGDRGRSIYMSDPDRRCYSCEHKRESGDPLSILFTNCEDCGESGEHCADHYSLIKWAIGESKRQASEGEGGESDRPLLALITIESERAAAMAILFGNASEIEGGEREQAIKQAAIELIACEQCGISFAGGDYLALNSEGDPYCEQCGELYQDRESERERAIDYVLIEQDRRREIEIDPLAAMSEIAAISERGI